MNLRPYQTQFVEDVLRAWDGNRAVLGIAPTGSGKTVMAAELIRRRHAIGGRTLFLADARTLVEQAAEKVQSYCGLTVGIEMADSARNVRNDGVTVATVQTLVNRLDRFGRNYFDRIIVDEAHRNSLGAQPKAVFDYFQAAKILGITATPNRSDKKTLAEVYDDIACELHLRDLIRDGYLSPIKILQSPVDIDISGVRKDASGDLSRQQLGQAIGPHLHALAKLWMETARNRKTVMFLPLIEVSKQMVEVLRSLGVRAIHVDGTESSDLAGDYEIVCNAQLLSTGWDCPEISCVYIARPTQSQSLYAQMIGRGTRIADGKDDLLVLDPVWASDRLQLASPAKLVALDDEMAGEMTERIQKAITAGQPVDLIAVEDEVEEDRASGLLEALRRNRKKSKKLFDPLDYAEMTNDVRVAAYEPTFKWEVLKPTPKQIETLAKFGFDVATIETRGQASILLDSCFVRRKSGMASPKQIRWLAKQKVKDAHKLTSAQASEMMSRMIAQRARWRSKI